MTVTTSYPGVYIQELPNLNHSITASPTSIAVFVGYTHPFLTPSANYLTAIQLFSVADYQTNFGGFFSSPWLRDYVGQAVYEFFLNGGPSCYVVGLPAKEYYSGGAPATEGGNPVLVEPATVVLTGAGGTVTFTAKQPVGIAATSPATGTVGIPMQVAISNLQSSNAMADIVISYGTTVETYRQVPIAGVAAALQASRLVSVAVSSPPPTAYPTTGSPFSLGYGASAPQAGWTIINPTDFGQVFEDYASLDKVPIFNLLATPGISDYSVTSAAVAYCERKRAFFIMDTPSPETTKWGPQSNISWDANDVVKGISNGTLSLSAGFPVSTNAALYYPWLQTTDLVTGAATTAPPSGFVAGMYGQEDSARGVWKSPAGIETSLLGTTGVDPAGVMTDAQQGILNENALDCLRQFPSIGTVIYGARTTAGADANTAQQQWKYVAVRRMALFIEQTLYANLTWAVFEPNSQPLWDALAQEINAFMLSLFRQGAFAGTSPRDSFIVQCDSTTTTPTDVAGGVVNILVGFAPLLPAEFVVVQIAQLAGQAHS
jgi:phage tail sheath protein FI